ncbi:MAG TPA: hypothetical protein VGJ57_05150 [Nitrospirales bacterium]
MDDKAFARVHAAYDRSEKRRLQLVALLRQILKFWDNGDLKPYDSASTDRMNALFEEARRLTSDIDTEPRL